MRVMYVVFCCVNNDFMMTPGIIIIALSVMYMYMILIYQIFYIILSIYLYMTINTCKCNVYWFNVYLIDYESICRCSSINNYNYMCLRTCDIYMLKTILDISMYYIYSFLFSKWTFRPIQKILIYHEMIVFPVMTHPTWVMIKQFNLIQL